MENLRISYFKNSHFEWSEKEAFPWKLGFTIVIWVFNFLTNSVLSSKELLNFQTPDPRAKISLLTKEQKTGEWSDDRAFRIYVFSQAIFIRFDVGNKTWHVFIKITLLP